MFLCVALVFIGIGYATYQSTLTITGTLAIPANVVTIGNSTFYGNQIDTLNLGSELTSIGTGAFNSSGYNLKTVNIDMTEVTWNSSGLVSVGWYGSPTFHFNS